MSPQNSAKLTRIVAYGFLAFAFVWGLAPYGGFGEASRLLLDLLDWPFGDAAPALDRSEMWLSSIGAGLTVAICIMLLGIVVPALERSDKNTIRVTIWAFVAWYVVDSVGSAASGVASNAAFNLILLAFNLILLAAILVPLMAIRYEESSS